MKYLIDISLRLTVLTVIIILSLCLISIVAFFLSPNTSINSTKLITFFPSVIIGCGVLIAYFTYIGSQDKRVEESNRHKSEVLLTSASNGFKRVIDLLKNHNNDNYSWSQAANIVDSIASIRDGISENEYKGAYHIEELIFKRELTKILSLVLPDNDNITTGLPPTFFYGIKEWNGWKPLGHNYLQDLHKAALQAGDRVVTYPISYWSLQPASITSAIGINDIKAIYNFLAEGKDREKDKEIWNDNVDAYWIKHGPIVFIRHYVKYGVLNQEVIDKETREVVYPKNE